METNGDDDAESISSEDDPSLLLRPSQYESLVCGTCVKGDPLLLRWAAVRAPGIRLIVQTQGERNDQNWTVVGEDLPVHSAAQAEEEEIDVVHVDGLDEASTTVISNDERRTASSLKRLRSPPPQSSGSLDGRKGEGTPGSPSRKRLRMDDSSKPSTSTSKSACQAPNPVSYDLVRETDGEISTEGDIFLSEGWRERWCRCSEVGLYSS